MSQELQAEIQSFLATEDLYSTYTVKNGEWTELRLHSLANPPARWGALVGDVIHNLRSSLDVLVYQLVEDNEPAKLSKSTAFPIANSAPEYKAKAGRATDGLHPDARAVLDELSPYAGGNDALYLLHQLDVEDKHHLLLALASSADQGLMVGPPSAPDPSGFRFQPVQMMSRKMSAHLFPLEDGSLLMKTNVPDPDTTLPFFVFVPMFAIKPDGAELHEEVIELLNRLTRASLDVFDRLGPFLKS